jgi:hypothetical protein
MVLYTIRSTGFLDFVHSPEFWILENTTFWKMDLFLKRCFLVLRSLADGQCQETQHFKDQRFSQWQILRVCLFLNVWLRTWKTGINVSPEPATSVFNVSIFQQNISTYGKNCSDTYQETVIIIISLHSCICLSWDTETNQSATDSPIRTEEQSTSLIN